MTTNIDQYLINGCMRCKYGGSPKCKINQWRTEIEMLRKFVLETGLVEEMKWGVPVYTQNGKNIVSVNALKDSANISFFNGVLLTDKHKILQQQGNLQSERILKFTNITDLVKLKDIVSEYLIEAIAIEESGAKVTFKKNPEPIPEELKKVFSDDPTFEKAFKSLTLGRQRGYIIHFSQPKQTRTRVERIQKYKEQIFKGIGLNDQYKALVGVSND
jgi:uncharacterized protein YdeI (YjbR/CyaY-like superfamily)